MGVSTDAILFYGYCWDEEARTPWEIDAADEAEGDEEWEERYARANGLPPASPWAAKKKLVDAATCLVDTHCSASCPMPLVAARASVTRSWRGNPSRITVLSTDPAWDAQLAEFCATMRIKIDGMTPAWWLVSDWGE